MVLIGALKKIDAEHIILISSLKERRNVITDLGRQE